MPKCESLGMLPTLMGRWGLRQKKVLQLQSEASDKGGMITSMSKTFRMLVQSLILGLGAYLAVKQEINPGLMIAGSILLGRALAPIDLMIGSWKGFISARSQYSRLNEILDLQQAEPQRMSLPVPEGHVLVVPWWPTRTVPWLPPMPPCVKAVALIIHRSASTSAHSAAMSAMTIPWLHDPTAMSPASVYRCPFTAGAQPRRGSGRCKATGLRPNRNSKAFAARS